MKVYIGNDHGGYQLKLKIEAKLRDFGYGFVDVGCNSESIVRYPYYAAKVAYAVSQGACDRGILICSTGIGMEIVANKYPGIRAALCHSTYEARMTRQHNDSNILCLGGKTLGEYEAIDIVETWLTEKYIGGRHAISLELIQEIEAMNLTGQLWQSDVLES